MRLKNLIYTLTVWLCLSQSTSIAQGQAQAYPDSSASWCAIDLGGSAITHIHMIMGANPDTVILGETYKRIDHYNTAGWFESPVLVHRYYVRSDTLGRGFVMLLDSMQEYLAVDISAVAGDTVADVLVGLTTGPDSHYHVKPVIVDSVIELENNGVPVTRQFVHALGSPPIVPYIGYYMFWQSGTGNAVGPVLILGMVYGDLEPMCLRVRDTYVYNAQTGNPALPGVPCDCSLSSVGIEELNQSEVVTIVPNPSTGIFTQNSPTLGSTVYTSTGQELFQSTGQAIDLSAYPPGLYHAVVRTAQGVGHVRLMVVR